MGWKTPMAARKVRTLMVVTRLWVVMMVVPILLWLGVKGVWLLYFCIAVHSTKQRWGHG